MGGQSGGVQRFFSRVFKERQIYHRSDGVVHFISMSTKTQVAFASIAGAALLWIAYASVNVVFKEQIIVKKDRDARNMERSFEREILRRQQEYEDIDALFQTAKTEFRDEIDVLRGRHATLSGLIDRAEGAEALLSDLSKELATAGAPNGEKPKNGVRIMVDQDPGEPTPRQSRSSALQRDAALEAAHHAQVSSAWLPPAMAVDADGADPLKLRQAHRASQTLIADQLLLLAAIEERAARRTRQIKAVLEAVGVGAQTLASPGKIVNVPLAQGGPFIDADNKSDFGTPFFARANRTGAAVQEFALLASVLENIPLSSPITEERRFTSGFGIRKDPFSGRRGAHYGVDFAAWRGTPIRATAKGVVVFSGTRSTFGKLVEIDHGNGFKTRYAHLRRRTVKAGERVELHDQIGELGSTGRSSGPHVHYEVLFKGKQVNPMRFIEAGRYVFES
ncbi:MAG: M23 family metallopeptidase [Pseudomonadota bacterium]